MAYILDANVFIQAKNLHYGFDFCPGFWEWLIKQNQSGKIFSIEKVQDEILAGNDELGNWAKNLTPDFFLKPDELMLKTLPTVSQWAFSAGYDQAAVSTFLQIADYYLVTYALAHQHTIVTHEIPSPTTKKIKIPNACIALGIKCMTPFEMLHVESAKFIMDPSCISQG